MSSHQGRGFALSGVMFCFAALSFSDTAQAQSVTVTPQVLTFAAAANSTSSQCNGGTDCKVHVTGVNVGTVLVQISSGSPWIVSAQAVNLPGDLSISVNTSG